MSFLKIKISCVDFEVEFEVLLKLFIDECPPAVIDYESFKLGVSEIYVRAIR